MNADFVDIIGILSLVLGILALGFALYQSLESGKQSRRLENHSRTLITITDSLSTRYIGEFPNYLTDVTSMIDRADKEVRIMKTTPLQAYFSDPTLWLSYNQALERKVSTGVDINIICLDKRGRKKRLQLQFVKPSAEWAAWRQENIEKIRHFLRFRYKSIVAESLGSHEFIDLLVQTQDDLIQEEFVLKGMSVTQISEAIPVQAWIIDAKEAVFTIQTLPMQPLGHAFITSDARIVSALHQMTRFFTEIQKEGQEMFTRIDNIVVTQDLKRSIALYKDLVGLEMRAYSNPVLIFKYEFASIYVYESKFFQEMFGINKSGANGMLSIELPNRQEMAVLRDRLASSKDLCSIFGESERKFFIKDFNELTIGFWVDPQKD